MLVVGTRLALILFRTTNTTKLLGHKLNIESIILAGLFGAFDKGGVKYSVLRNYELLPKSLGGSDLDLAVLPEQLSDAAYLVKENASRFGGDVIVDYYSSGRIMRTMGCYQGHWWGMAIDLFSHMEYKGVEYVTTRCLIERSVDHQGVKVCSESDSNIVALIKELLSNGRLRKTYFEDAVSSYHEDTDNARALIERIFSPSISAAFQDFLSIRVKKPDEVHSIAKKMQRDVLWRFSYKELISRFKNLYYRMKRVLNPAGYTIAVVGPENSVNDSLIEEIIPVLGEALHNCVKQKSLRPRWLKSHFVSENNGVDSENSEEGSKPLSEKPALVKKMIFLVMMALDYTIGYWVGIHPHLIKRPCIFVFNQYSDDLFKKPEYAGYTPPSWVVKLAFCLAPQPHIVLKMKKGDDMTISKEIDSNDALGGSPTSDEENTRISQKRLINLDAGQNLDGNRHLALSHIQRYLAI